MKERTRADISIMRNGEVLLTIPITPSSKRKFSLMKEDSITLDFTLPKKMVYTPEIGDYVEDELFGRFVVCESQQATYEARVGGWRYSLLFKACYWIFNNKELMLITSLSNGRKVRKESTWTLTNNLDAQMQALKENIEILGYEGWDYQILPSAAKQDEVRMVTYNATHIIDALNNFCEQWECEWWVRGKVFYLGKCEDDGDYIDFSEGVNVESMTINKDENVFCNRLYCYGSKDNIPYSYRKSINMKISQIVEQNGLTYYIPDKQIEARYVDGTIRDGYTLALSGWVGTDGLNTERRYYKAYQAEATIRNKDKRRVQIAIDTQIKTVYYHYDYGNHVMFDRVFEIVLAKDGREMEVLFRDEDNVTLGGYNNTFWYYMTNGGGWVDVHLKRDLTLAEGEYKIIYRYSLVLQEGAAFGMDEESTRFNTLGMDEYAISDDTDGIEVSVQASETEALGIRYSLDGHEKKVMVKLNPMALVGDYPSAAYGLVCVNDSGEYVKNDDFCTDSEPKEGKTSHIVLDDGESIGFPESLYSEDYEDPSSLLRLGELRLQLPEEVSSDGFEMRNNEIWTEEGDFVCRNGYIEAADIASEDSVVEGAVAFEKIYPDGKMVVSEEPVEVVKQYTDDYYDGSKRTYDFTEYTLRLTLADGTPFVFKEEYRLDDTQLQLRFLSPEDIGEMYVGEGGKMSGMTFEVRFNEISNAEEGLEAGTFTIVRNDAFGAKLPNSIIRPYFGDPCVLVGWKVKALRGMGLIGKAELELLRKGVEYMREMRKNQCTITCKMMSDFSFVASYKQFYTNEDLPFHTNEDLPFMVRDGDNLYMLLVEGTRICVENKSLKDGMMKSRIIGYEMCLDMPYDSPTYIIGETHAYSRLAKIEKDLTKLG